MCKRSLLSKYVSNAYQLKALFNIDKIPHQIHDCSTTASVGG